MPPIPKNPQPEMRQQQEGRDGPALIQRQNEWEELAECPGQFAPGFAVGGRHRHDGAPVVYTARNKEFAASQSSCAGR